MISRRAISQRGAVMSSGAPITRALVTWGEVELHLDPPVVDEFIDREVAGRYRIRAHLASGGMADVYRATDAQLGIDVAIKLARLPPNSEDLHARMVLEARAAARVRHPNLVRVFGAGTFAGSAFIVMELLAGPNLEKYLGERDGGRLAWPDALALLLPAMDALHAVHEHGYLHRDIKPGNILVTRDLDDAPTAVVIDLGLVKPLAGAARLAADHPPSTATGRVLCTPSYASPEQALGQPVDRRSDVYALALTLYRVLAGRLPFHAVHGRPVLEVLARRVHADPTRLVDLVDLPPAIADVIETGLRRDPAARHPTLRAFAHALRAAAEASRVPARAPITPSRFYRSLWSLTLGLAAAGLSTSPEDAAYAFTCPPITRPLDAPPPPGACVDDPVVAPRLDSPPRDPPRHGPRVPPTGDLPTRPAPDAGSARLAYLTRVTPVVERCAERAGGGVDRIAVHMVVDRRGEVSAEVVGAKGHLLGRCVAAALRAIPFPERIAAEFHHTFHVQARP
jgi:serine/threonine protein kinase